MTAEDSRGAQREEPSNVQAAAKEFVQLAWAGAVDEWERRNKYGKLVYPIWLVGSTLTNALFFAFMGFMVAVARFHAAMESSNDGQKEWMYKDGETDDC